MIMKRTINLKRSRGSMINRKILMLTLSIALHVLVVGSLIYATTTSLTPKNQAQWESPTISIALTQAEQKNASEEAIPTDSAPEEIKINSETFVEKAAIAVPKKQNKVEKKTEDPIKPKETKIVKNAENPKKPLEKKTVPQTSLAQQQKDGSRVSSQSLGSKSPITQQVSGSEDNQLINAYREKLRQEVERNKQYPRRAKKMKNRGIAKVQFQLNHNGEISLIRLESSSGNEQLDNAALLAVQKSNSVGKPPAGFAQSITLNIEFH